jgi:hypothetical protein
MTLSLGRLIFVATLLSIIAISCIMAMDVYASLQDVAHQYPSNSSL